MKNLIALVLAVAVVVIPTSSSLGSISELEPELPRPVVDPWSGYEELKQICTCESGLTHFNEDGTVLRGRVNNLDIGICQINLTHHGERMESLNLDPFSQEDNITYSKILFDESGSQHWYLSKGCHGL